MDGDDLVAQSYAFLLAGFETSSSTMTFALYELSLQPAIQDRLRTEIKQVTEKYNQEITYEALLDMQYLDMVVSGECHGYLNYILGLCTTNTRNTLEFSALQRL
jgi:cytochrome P450 family 6